MGAKKRKKAYKLFRGRCTFCPETNLNILDTHRILPGSEGGEYHIRNSLIVCSNCHRRIHAGEITCDRKYLRTDGRWVLRYFEDGQEKWVECG